MAFPDKDWLPDTHQSSWATRLVSDDLAPVDVAPLAQKADRKTGENDPGRLQFITGAYDLA